MQNEMVELISQIDKIKKNFHTTGGNGIPETKVIQKNADFFEWKQALEFELQQIYDYKKDTFIFNLLILLRQKFDGWSDEQDFNELRGGLLTLKKNIDFYYPQDNIPKEVRKEMNTKIFISHASIDIEYVEKLVDLFIDMGVREDQIFCSSVPGFGIPEGEDIYEYLREQFNEYELYVVFVLSENYYRSIACMNEMGAAWALRQKYTIILLPEFEYKKIDGAINPRQISLKLDDDIQLVQERLGEIKRNLQERFQLPSIADTRWERKRDHFIKEINEIVPQAVDSDFQYNIEDDLELNERGYYTKISELQAGKKIRYCAACYQKTGKLFPITQGSLRRDHFCTNCRMHYS